MASGLTTTKNGQRNAPARRYDPEKTRRNILAVATKEFAKDGFNGARIDSIAARTSTTKRMIYYYFGGKERSTSRSWNRSTPISGTRRPAAAGPPRAGTGDPALTEFTFDYDHANPNFVRLVAIENIHHARHLSKSRGFARSMQPSWGRSRDPAPRPARRKFRSSRAPGRRAHADERLVLFSRVQPSYVRHDFRPRPARTSGGRTRSWSRISSSTC